MANEKWRGVLGGLEETKSGGAPAGAHRARTLRVRPVRGGFAVFGEGTEPLSQTHAVRDDAVAEAEELAGEGGIVLVEADGGHVEREIHATRLRPSGA